MNPRSNQFRAGLLTVLVLVGVACSSRSDDTVRDPASTTQATLPATTASATDSAAATGGTTAAAVQAALDDWAREGSGGASVALANSATPQFVLAAGMTGNDGEPMTPDAEFRIGSLTKTFVAAMILQLVADGEITLDDPVTQYLPEVTIVDGVSIRQLLAHRSGIPEHTDGELAPAVLADPDRTWTPDDVIALVADQPLDFPPGEQFAYSNTNYVIAGMLLERLTGDTLAANLDARIVTPLGLESTYFPPDLGRQPIVGFSTSLPGGSTAGASYRALETAAGAAGAIVSTASDVAVFIRALVDGDLLPPDVYAEMTQGLPDDGESLGVFPGYPPTATGISNAGAIPGFIAYMQYDPATEELLVLLLSDDTRPPEQLGNRLTTILQNG